MKLAQISQTKLAATPLKFVVDAPAHDNLFASVATTKFVVPTKVNVPIGPPKLGPTEFRYEGDSGEDSFTLHSSSSDTTPDIVNGGGGEDYFSTGGGSDVITVGNNDGDWRGIGNEFTLGSTTVDASSGDDRIVVDATKGAFHLTTGEGSDTVVVKGGDYVKIDAADDDTQSDTFVFAATFGGVAELYGVDNAYQDTISLQGGGSWEGGVWSEINGGFNGELAFHNEATGGTVIVHGSSATNLGAMPTWMIEPF